MPLYEYKCHSCGKTFEVLQKFSDEPLKVHDECGGEVERLLSAPAFHLKGTGWYATDYAKGSGGGPGKPAETKSGESKSDSASDTKSSDSKPATETKSGESKPAAAATSDSK